MRFCHVLLPGIIFVLAASVLAVLDGDHCRNWLGSGFWKRATVEKVRQCLDVGADVMARTKYGITPLHRAAEHGSAATVRALIDAGAHAEARTDAAVTPLLSAVQEGKAETVRALLDARADTGRRTRF